MGVTLIHEVHDMWPATLIELGGMSRKHPFIQILQMAENCAYKKSDKVVSLLPNAEVYMTQHGLEKGKFINIPNGIVEEEWNCQKEIPSEMKSILDGLHKKGKFIVGYFGGHALSNALDSLIDVACLLKDKSDIHFVLVGKGVEKARLQNRCKDENLNNVTFMNAVEKRCIPSLLTHFDCIYIGLADSTLYRFGLALNKFYDAMMSGKPIILSTNVKNTVIEQNACGIIVPSEDERAIKEAILNVKNMSIEKRCEMGRKGTIAVKEKYRYEKLADDFLKVIGKEKKNILLINHYAGSPEMGMEFRPYYFAKEWVKKGYRVDIIAADYSHLRIKNPKIAKDFEEEVIDGIHYHWIHTREYQGNGAKRAITMFQFVGKLWLNAKRIASDLSPDVVITSSTYPLDTYVGQKIRNKRRGMRK